MLGYEPDTSRHDMHDISCVSWRVVTGQVEFEVNSQNIRHVYSTSITRNDCNEKSSDITTPPKYNAKEKQINLLIYANVLC